jgi:TonB-linked SusC/RagA family outer membrane protein
LNIAAKVMVKPLDEVQMIAYGTTTRRFSTGSVSTVTSTEIKNQPVNNPLLALQGRMPGVFITQNTGVPGGGVNVQIRGRNSISNRNDPLFVIDGVPYSSQLLPNLAGNILQQSNENFAAGAGNPLSFINPSDIETISVLKDADATAIYGSRGANGVVLINTKKGRIGKSKASFNLSNGVSKIPRFIELLNTEKYIEMRKEAFNHDGESPNSANAPDLKDWDTTKYTNWQKELIGGTAHYTDLQASISGGNANTQYLIGGAYHKETTVFPGNFSDKKASFHFNIKTTSTNGKLNTTLSGNYMGDKNTLPIAEISNYVSLPPNAPDLYNGDGSLNWANNTFPDGINPLYFTKQEYNARTNNIVSNLNLSYQLIKGLEITSSFEYTNMQVKEIATTPISSLSPFSPIKTGSASFTDNSTRSWIIEPQATYEVTIGPSKINALVGTTIQQNTSEGQIISATGYTSDAQLQNIQAGPNRIIGSVTNSNYKYNALFARLNYNLKNKYVVNLTARRDGSSRFGENNRFHTFGSIGAAWIFSQENFVQKGLSFLSFGKLRSSYGSTGSDQIGDYRFFDLFSTSSYTYQGVIGLTPSGFNNPNLEWEETKKFEVGLDLGFLKDRIILNVGYYNNRSSNQLINYNLPSLTGFTSTPDNFPATVENKGWEFSFNSINIQSKKISWTSSFNFTIPRNNLLSFPNIENTPYASTLVIGQPIRITRAFYFRGVNDTTGLYEFVDIKGNATFNPNSTNDKTVLINTAPKFYGGFSNTLNYNGFQLDLTLQFTKQLGKNPLFKSFSPPGGFSNVMRENLSRWKNPGDRTLIQHFTQSYSSNAFVAYRNVSESDYAYSDASFIRLKNISVSYQIPSNWLKKLNFQSFRVYVAGQNLLTISKYKGIDPENNNLNALPPLRVLVFGIEMSL